MVGFNIDRVSYNVVLGRVDGDKPVAQLWLRNKIPSGLKEMARAKNK